MKTIKMTVSNRFRLPECWLSEGRSIIYTNKGREVKNLPIIETKYAQLLAQLEIPFVSQGEDLQYWDPKLYEETDWCLPLYRRIGDQYRYLGMHTGKALSQASTEAAYLLQKMLSDRIDEFDAQCQQEYVFNELRRYLGGNEAVGINYQDNEVLRNGNWWLNPEITLNGERILVLPVRCLMSEERQKYFIKVDEESYQLSTDYLAIFAISQIQENSVIKLKVPAGMEGLFIGRKGWQVKAWCKKLGIERIEVEKE